MMEKEKKPKAVKKTNSTTNESGAMELVKPKKTATKKKSTAVEMSTNGTGPKKTAPPKKTTATPTVTEPKMTQMKVSHDEIARLAHRYWAERGGQHGSHEEDWLRAERELRGKAS
jgi:hypothetical protein